MLLVFLLFIFEMINGFFECEIWCEFDCFVVGCFFNELWLWLIVFGSMLLEFLDVIVFWYDCLWKLFCKLFLYVICFFGELEGFVLEMGERVDLL